MSKKRGISSHVSFSLYGQTIPMDSLADLTLRLHWQGLGHTLTICHRQGKTVYSDCFKLVVTQPQGTGKGIIFLEFMRY